MIDKKTARWIKMMDFFAQHASCHQMPEWSFFFHGYQFPLCARCTGILIGYIAGLIFGIIFNLPWEVIFLVVPLAVDGTVQLKTSYESTNLKRLITGILYGFDLVGFILSIIKMIF